MSVLRFTPKGIRKWAIYKAEGYTAVGIITEGASGALVLTVFGGGLDFHEVEAVANFMQHTNEEDEIERARR